ncbi:hypothetical protein [Oceanobacter mangrovi]|uniref:hypothetical protein n=1 Tax=Oceanobacter mangrovi TaxID=2862510 RepID=UPI001C8D63DD|nr:hypothetical protein [Oceanobacter mangrovi]
MWSQTILWLPWNHTFGGNKNIGLVLYNGGTLYIDNGKPTPRDIHKTLIDHPLTREVFQNLLADMAAVATGSSNKVLRMTLESVLPALDAHEITDKGSINQRAVLENRAATVETLYTGAIAPGVIGLK